MAFENIRLEKGMYREAGKTFTQVLEGLDPSEAYKGTALEGTDAFQRQLKRFGIRVKGAGSDKVEKFFSSAESSVLFPEFICRIVRQGMDDGDILPSIVATVTNIDSLDYRSISSTPSEDDLALCEVSEGASIPVTTIRTDDTLVQLRKRGRMLVASYEALRFQKLDLFSVMLRQIGAHIRRMQLGDAVNRILDVSVEYEIGEDPIGGTSGTLSYDALVDFWSVFHPYEMNAMLVSNSTMTKLLKLEEFKNPLTGLNFQGTGKFETPLGAKLLHSSAVPDGCIIGLDNRFALEMVQAGDISVEYDKLIDRQLERAAITAICGFSTLCDEASAKLSL